jgi:hypothetical protein
MSEGQSFFDKAKDAAGDMKDKVSDMLGGDDDQDQPEGEMREASQGMPQEGMSDEGMEDMPQSDYGQDEPPQ